MINHTIIITSNVLYYIDRRDSHSEVPTVQVSDVPLLGRWGG